MLKTCYPTESKEEKHRLEKQYEDHLAYIRVLYEDINKELEKAKKEQKELERLNLCK